MGKGDRKTRKGKVFKSSFGKSRRRKKKHIFPDKTAIRPTTIKCVRRAGPLHKNMVNQLVFPILTKDKKGYKFIGSGFFINQFGWFVTAKHVAMEDDQKPINPFIVVQVISETECIVRTVKGFWRHPTADIVVGVLNPIYENGKRVENPVLAITESEIKEKEKVFTYAYPDSYIEDDDENFQIATFSPKYYLGEYVSTEHRNDSRLKGEFLHTTIDVKSGASGGPVFDKNGYVLGINTASYDVPKGEVPISFITPIKLADEVEVRYEDGFKKFSEIKKMGGVMVEKLEMGDKKK